MKAKMRSVALAMSGSIQEIRMVLSPTWRKKALPSRATQRAIRKMTMQEKIPGSASTAAIPSVWMKLNTNPPS